MSYSLATLWHERQRYLPGVLAVGFSSLLISLQCGLLMGLFSITSIPIDHSDADLWVGAPGVLSVDLGEMVRESYLARVAAQPEVTHCELYLQGFSYWSKPKSGRELCMVAGSRLYQDSPGGALGGVYELTPELREKLTEPGAIVVDESDLGRLGVTGVGDRAEVSGRAVRIVGLTRGLKSLAGPYVFCSITTARGLLPRGGDDQTTYVLAKCRDRNDAPAVVARLRATYSNLSAFTKPEFSFRSQMHWLLKTKAGIALGYAAALGLLVGAVVTSQTLYAATAASLREFAVLRALGIPRWRMGLMVMAQSFWVGALGVALALPAVYMLAWLADELGVRVLLPMWLLASATGVTLTMALGAGLLALRSLRQVEPAALLR
jgi:putative ABC transport system permease protein